MLTLEITTKVREEMADITDRVLSAIEQAGWQDGAVLVFCPHTTCGLTLNECADPDVQLDLQKFFQEIAPLRHGWRHLEGNSDAHIRASLLGSSLLLPLEAGCLCLGRWQGIFLYEGDGPRRRSVRLKLLRA